MTVSYRDHVIARSKDLGRSIDYLETRPDVDRSRVAYENKKFLPANLQRIPVASYCVRDGDATPGQ
jgi:hypothetical protein